MLSLPKIFSAAMAKRNAAGTVRAEAPTAVAVTDKQAGPEQQFIVFKCGGSSFAFGLNDIGEILRVPRLVHMPLAPRSLLGLANLRGVVLPVVSLASLLGLPCSLSDESARVIVAGQSNPVGFVVDQIDNLVSLPADKIETGDAGSGSIDPDLLEGVVKGAEGADTIKILNRQRLLRGEFSHLGLTVPRSTTAVSLAAAPQAPAAPEAQQHLSLLSF